MSEAVSLMTGVLRHRTYPFSFPATVAPSWAAQLERWYQLDAFAWGLPQAVVDWKLDQRLKEVPPSQESTEGLSSGSSPAFVILASPEGSNRTDYDFAQTFLKNGVGSPSKFVHTLPNSRSAALLQVWGWSGPLLCLQDDPHTFVVALTNAMREVARRQKCGWIFGVTRQDQSQHCVHLFEVIPGFPITKEIKDSTDVRKGPASTHEFRWQARDFGVKSTVCDDKALMSWLTNHQAMVQVESVALELDPDFEIDVMRGYRAIR